MRLQTSLLLVPTHTSSEGIAMVITERGAVEWPHRLNCAVMGPKPDLFHTTKQKPHMEWISSITPEHRPETQGDPEACYDIVDRTQLFERLYRYVEQNMDVLLFFIF